MISKFQITDAARRRLMSWLTPEVTKELVPTITWSTSMTGESFWSVGAFSRSKIDVEKIAILDGIEFYIEEWWHEQLDGTTLDLVEGYFKIADRRGNRE